MKFPKGVKEQLWIKYNGTEFYGKCFVPWCKNVLTVFDFSVGHNIPKSKGGSNSLDNLRPICSRCNTSMGNTYSIDEWINTYQPKYKYFCCF